jgi:hypothetical protein
MASHRRVFLLVVLAVALGLFLLDAHGSPEQLKTDMRETWSNLRELPIFNRE